MEIVATSWDNRKLNLLTPEKVYKWLRNNIASIDSETSMLCETRANASAKVGWLSINTALTAGEITQIETQYPELVGKVVP